MDPVGAGWDGGRHGPTHPRRRLRHVRRRCSGAALTAAAGATMLRAVARTDRREGQRAELEVDRLPDPRTPLQVLAVGGVTFDAAGFRTRFEREPHRHDYHELVWTRSGVATHLLDGALVPIGPGTVTVIGRGQVHLWREATDLSGTIVRFRDELLAGAPSSAGAAGGGAALRAHPQVVEVPAEEADGLEGLLGALGAEQAAPGDPASLVAAGHLLAVVLLWLERWARPAGARPPGAGEAARIQHRFTDVLERDFTRHHHVGHYADALALPATALSAALVRASGRTTKEQVVDRVMLEAARLLRFTDLSVGQVAFRVGFGDQAYFSRTFKRRHGVAPSAFREGPAPASAPEAG